MTDEQRLPVSFVGALGVTVWHEEGRTSGVVDLHPSMWAIGTQRPRLGILAILTDFVISSPPGHLFRPTVDLRVELVETLPSAGRLRAQAKMLKVGRRLAVGEAGLDIGGRPFARATATFVNPEVSSDSGRLSPIMAFPPTNDAPTYPESFEALIGLIHREPQIMVVEPTSMLRNGPGGTIQGGIQVMIAEIAAEAVLGGSAQWMAVDADYRFLDVVRTGPVVASSNVIAKEDRDAYVRTIFRDAGDHHPERIVAYAAIRCRPVEVPN